MKYATAISPLAMKAAMPVKRPIAMSRPQTNSMPPPPTFIRGGKGPAIAFGIPGYPRSYCVASITNIRPAMMRSNANVCAEKRPITSGILHLRRDGVHVARQPGAAIAPQGGGGLSMRIRGVIIVIAILFLCTACNRRPAKTTTGSTDTLQPTSAGTTATETGTGAPVTNTATTSTNGTSTSTTSTTATSATSSTGTY